MAGSGTELWGKEEGGGAAVRDSFIIRSQGEWMEPGWRMDPGKRKGLFRTGLGRSE